MINLDSLRMGFFFTREQFDAALAAHVVQNNKFEKNYNNTYFVITPCNDKVYNKPLARSE